MCFLFKFWPVRLSARTLGSQPSKRGPTPLRATIKTIRFFRIGLIVVCRGQERFRVGVRLPPRSDSPTGYNKIKGGQTFFRLAFFAPYNISINKRIGLVFLFPTSDAEGQGGRYEQSDTALPNEMYRLRLFQIPRPKPLQVPALQGSFHAGARREIHTFRHRSWSRCSRTL